MVKPVPVLGTLVLVGAIVQVILGFQVAGGLDSLTGVRMLIRIAGLVLVIALMVAAFRAKTATLMSKAVMTVLTLVVLLQVSLGFQVLGGAESMVTSHMANGFLIVILALAAGGHDDVGTKSAKPA
jgi:hypothetical protein